MYRDGQTTTFTAGGPSVVAIFTSFAAVPALRHEIVALRMIDLG
jgi:hypothetical protein